MGLTSDHCAFTVRCVSGSRNLKRAAPRSERETLSQHVREGRGDATSGAVYFLMLRQIMSSVSWLGYNVWKRLGEQEEGKDEGGVG